MPLLIEFYVFTLPNFATSGIYFGLVGQDAVILLVGGEDSTQQKDIATAVEYWKEYKNDGN